MHKVSERAKVNPRSLYSPTIFRSNFEDKCFIPAGSGDAPRTRQIRRIFRSWFPSDPIIIRTSTTAGMSLARSLARSAGIPRASLRPLVEETSPQRDPRGGTRGEIALGTRGGPSRRMSRNPRDTQPSKGRHSVCVCVGGVKLQRSKEAQRSSSNLSVRIQRADIPSPVRFVGRSGLARGPSATEPRSPAG